MQHKEHRILYGKDENFQFEAFSAGGLCSVAAEELVLDNTIDENIDMFLNPGVRRILISRRSRT
jgi:hypothetical protein